MAHIFPSIFPKDVSSSGERKVFEYLKANAPIDWYIFHSFRLPRHKTVVFGEADFVVVAPKLGIFILEIKSGGVGFDGTNWVYINREQQRTYKQRGPFQQAREAMFEIEKIIIAKLGSTYSRMNIMYNYGVIFTDESNFPTFAITEDEVWRLIQKREKVDYCVFIEKLYKNFSCELTQLNKLLPPLLTTEKAESIAKVLRPIVDCVVPLKSFVSSSEEDIIALTEEQYCCLDDIELNDQMVITGGAGTGKTLLAIEEAKRNAIENKHIGFFCYNKNLADYIKTNINIPGIDVYSFHSFLMKICGNKLLKEEKTERFFKEILPRAVCEHIAISEPYYEKIIVDEFQDICCTEYLNVLDKILAGGLMNGKFTFYGDFARQAIYNENASLEILKNYAFFARKGLTVNCRNTQYIGNELINISGYKDKGYKLKITGEPVDYFVWNTINEEKELLMKCITNLKKKGFASSSLMVLSPKKRENSVVNICDEEIFTIGNYGDNCELYYAMFSTIQGFKGLESEITLITDIDDYSDSQLMYIALSRARSKMIVLESSQAAKQRQRMLITR